MVFGGAPGESNAKLAHQLTLTNMSWSALPDMPHAHDRPVCGLVRKQNSNLREIVVAGNYNPAELGVSILKLDTLEWRKGRREGAAS